MPKMQDAVVNRPIKIKTTNLLDCAPLRLVSITIIEKMMPENPMAHSFMKNG